jgi:hypothetical protein
VGSFEDRLRKLEKRFMLEPTVDECLDASNRESVRALHALAERLAPYGFDGDYLFTEHSLRVLAEDTPERREGDRETVEAWRKAQGIDLEMEAEKPKEKLLAKLEARGGK